MKKYLNASNIVACITFIFALVVLILYAVNFNSNGYYQGVEAPGLILFTILTMVFSLGIIGLSFVKKEGTIAKVVLVADIVLKVCIALFLMLVAMNLVSSRVEGIGYIFFSNADVAKEVATPANVGSAMVSFVAIGFAVVGAIAGIVGSFFLPKEEAK